MYSLASSGAGGHSQSSFPAAQHAVRLSDRRLVGGMFGASRPNRYGIAALTFFFKQIYELATSSSLLGDAHDEASALHELMTLLGPLPQEWVGSLGAANLFRTVFRLFFFET